MTEAIRVLHVDDEPEFAEMAAIFLERDNDMLDVETATSASEGLDRLATDGFDCVVSDYDMLGQNGIEFLETVRDEYPDLPFILFTGKGSEDVASEAISAGATDYLQKEPGPEQFELLANRIQNVVDQYRSIHRATELDRIHTLASDINQILVRADSRAEAENRVCEVVSDSDPYLFAWIGTADSETSRIEPQTSAGMEEGYLDEITITTDTAPTGQGPGGTAIRERRVAISQNIAEDPEFDPWRDEALGRGYQSVAAVPLEYKDTLYGELVVYADRPNAFDEDERELLAELGDNIAHSFHSFDVRDQLRTERDHRQALFENAPTPVVAGSIHDDEHRISDVNDAFEDVFGYKAEEVVGRDIAEVVVPDDEMDSHTTFRERAAAGEATIREVTRVTAGGLRQFLITVIPYGVDDGQAAGWYGWLTDVTERKEREQAIEDLHRTTDALMTAETPEAVAELTTDAVRDILGLPANGVHLYDEIEGGLVPVAWTDRTEEIVGAPPTFTPGEGIAGTAFETGEPQIYDDISTVSERFNPDTVVRSQIVLPLDDHGVLVIGSPEPDAFNEVDVSLAKTIAGHTTTALERIDREGELERRRELFEAVLETSIDGILVIDENREYVTWNQQFIDMWGIPEELVGTRPEEEGLEWVRDQLENPDEFLDKVEYLYEHPEEKSRDQIRLTDGRVFDRYSAPVVSDDGTYFGRVWFFRDITEREQREREFERKNERLETFASVVSHDLRSPLSVAEGRLELAREECDSLHLDNAADAVERSLTLIDDLLSVARNGGETGDVEAVTPAEMCEQSWQNVETADATLVVDTDQTIHADPSRINQLLENLFRNAVEHGGADVTVTVGDLPDGFYVADAGPGIPAEEHEQVFEAGYTTTEEGTGFGLSIVQEVADEHGWDISLTESETGGARFEITGVEIGG